MRRDGKPKRMLDLFCGRWGWSKAFAARGWECVGVDLKVPDEVPHNCEFICCDVVDINAEGGGGFWIGPGHHRYFDFVCASSPCEQFSLWGMRHFFPEPPYPSLGIRLFNHTRELLWDSGIQWIMENVRPAQKFVGKADHACGPYLLWGTGIPPILPQGISKGFGDMSTEHYHANLDKISPHIRAGNVATIPPELANCVADYAERLLEQRSAISGA